MRILEGLVELDHVRRSSTVQRGVVPVLQVVRASERYEPRAPDVPAGKTVDRGTTV